jgi:ATP synthase F1 epsilon subunit
MEENFKIEIISPEKVIFSDDIKIATLPSYEGDMSILKNHISIITFLRPGIIKVKNKDNNPNVFFVQDGTVEYFNNFLIVLSASAINIKDLSREFIDNLNKDTQEKIINKNITDHERYILNHKLDAIKEIRI